MRSTGKRVTLLGLMVPIGMATDVRAIAVASRRSQSDIGRQFFMEFWPDFLARHPELQALIEAGKLLLEGSEAKEAPETTESEIAATA